MYQRYEFENNYLNGTNIFCQKIKIIRRITFLGHTINGIILTTISTVK